MSLINQALRKAQRDRTPSRITDPADPGSTTATHAPVSGNGSKPTLIIGLVVALALLVGLVAGLSFVLLKGGDGGPDIDLAKRTEAVPTPASTTVEPSVKETAATLKPITQAVQPTERGLPLDRENTSSVVEDLRKARQAAEEAARAQAAAAEEAAARAAAKPSQDIIDWLARATITGVKVSEAESRVILNGESYAVGEYVNFSLGLKVMIIQEKRVLFVDNNGKKYMKRL